jgi:mannose-6-phosphate isomerase-like protein (cupin superfamily)
MAASFSDRRQISVFHASPEKVFVIGKDRFKVRHYTNRSKPKLELVSTTEITLAPSYNGFLLEKHTLGVDETLYALSGRVDCIGQTKPVIQLKPGDIAQIPAGTPYGCKAAGSEPSQLLVVSSSQALESLVTEIGTPANNTLQSSSEPDMGRVASVAQKYGIEFLN